MGKLSVVGIGPGNYENITIRADRALKECDTIAGYKVYVDLVKDIYPGKNYFTTAMTGEVERCRKAIEMAAQGKNVALICSGDSGIYGMAGLVYELAGKPESDGSKDAVEIEVIPGITAACSGASILGAPLTHDFAVISLSDRLTEWEKIVCRLKAAASSDFSIVLYNPASKGRPEHLKKACEILLEILPEDRICGVARNIARDGEEIRVLTLKELKDADIDMFCTVFIGNSCTIRIGDLMVTPRGYHGV